MERTHRGAGVVLVGLAVLAWVGLTGWEELTMPADPTAVELSQLRPYEKPPAFHVSLADAVIHHGFGFTLSVEGRRGRQSIRYYAPVLSAARAATADADSPLRDVHVLALTTPPAEGAPSVERPSGGLSGLLSEGMITGGDISASVSITQMLPDTSSKSVWVLAAGTRPRGWSDFLFPLLAGVALVIGGTAWLKRAT